MVEMAIALPFLVFLSIGLGQFAIFLHHEGVVRAAVQEGAHAAASLQLRGAARDQVGEQRTRAILAAGLPRQVYAGDRTPVRVTCLPAGCDDVNRPDSVEVEAQVEMPSVFPGIPRLPIGVTATANVERFRPGL